ncbi:hypothetical protein [Levilactobacillus fujinensis]|uniref:D-alanyl-D-alanine carboxypeptidase n=1 Tax=Levilactobacillus fujinensis TaxID=2486024 RepID=A0ABW1TDB4_9LACO|nr:hypothetical protein [Levilactobacillus fujinensis]
MSKQIWQHVAMAVVAAGIVSTGLTVTAAAKAQYSAQRSNAIRLIWRRSMGRHAVHATGEGARYSKHLGYRYGDLSTLTKLTFYTDAHEKVQVKATGKYRIYYHVKSSNGLFAAWVWRGYLQDGVAATLGQTGTAKPMTGKLNLNSAQSTAQFDKDVVAYIQQTYPTFKFKAGVNAYAQLESEQLYLNPDFNSEQAVKKLKLDPHNLNGSVAYITEQDFQSRLALSQTYATQVKNMAQNFEDLLPRSASPRVGIGFHTVPNGQMKDRSAKAMRAYYAVAYEDDSE